jgi:hypothetical protein
LNQKSLFSSSFSCGSPVTALRWRAISGMLLPAAQRLLSITRQTTSLDTRLCEYGSTPPLREILACGNAPH